MEVLKREDGSYVIASDGINHVISIVCGTSALFEVVVRLSDLQKEELLTSNAKLKEIIDNVRLNPSKI